MIFFQGKAKTVSSEKRFVDWKLLSFRHVWDLKHKVVVHVSFLGLSPLSLNGKVPFIDPEDNMVIRYWMSVENKREVLRQKGDLRFSRLFDANWTKNSKCTCSTCGKSYSEPRLACYCCYGTKPWMPFPEVDKINVKVGE